MTTKQSTYGPAACLALALILSCAPLTQPAPPASLVTPVAPDVPQEASPLEQYLQEREGQTESERYLPWIGVLPMVDDSGFEEGVYDLGNDVPRLLSAQMAEFAAWYVIPYEVVAQVAGEPPERWADDDLSRIGAQLQADILMVGTVLEYNLARLHLGDPQVGGYKAYTGLAEAELSVLDGTELSRLGLVHARQEIVDRDLGLDLLGRPRSQDLGFFTLGEIVYGGEEFERTALGQATLKMMEDLIQQLARLLQPRAIETHSGKPEVLSVFGDEIYINVGSENGVHRRYRFAVFPGDPRQGADPEEQIGVIEVMEVVSSRVSSAQVISGDGIAVGDRIKLIMADPE
ncbi:MAG: hypothetical protein HN712_12965 [Gemmatimonadetes bacterium]|nr:hypothetical protein [Gemmatimonadota bacterium]MBT7861225.1 hypothetical protein [Gemmatimonadota bacterium]